MYSGIQCYSHPVSVQSAKYLLCILSRLTAHCSIAEMPLKLMKSDQSTWTFINKLSVKKRETCLNCKRQKLQRHYELRVRSVAEET